MTINDWFEEEPEGEYPVSEYELTPSPNDFNILTLVSLMDSGVVKIPSFQRNYVWDIKRASKLIESLIIGLPVPQIFFFEQGKNNYLVIDGQQRLMTIYYFVKGRFPKETKRTELRRLFNERGSMPPETIFDDEYFSKFNLILSEGEKIEGYKNKFHKRNYETLLEHKMTFDLRTIRSIIVKQTSDNKEDTDDSALYELFNRLNTGGVNLTTQEIRVSLYDSKFMRIVLGLNALPSWRRLTTEDFDLHLRDSEMLLRSIALLFKGKDYIAPLGRFINTFSKKMKQAPDWLNAGIESMMTKYLDTTQNYDQNVFKTNNKKFSSVLFESVLYAACSDCLVDNVISVEAMQEITESKIENLKRDEHFIHLSTVKSTNTEVLKMRLEYAKTFLRS